jgi:hypothetical protein
MILTGPYLQTIGKTPQPQRVFNLSESSAVTAIFFSIFAVLFGFVFFAIGKDMTPARPVFLL